VQEPPGVDGEVDGLTGGEVGGVLAGVLGPVPPVQLTPLRAKADGTGLLPVHEPVKPNDTLPLVATEPL
jgi:hypothetical protein